MFTFPIVRIALNGLKIALNKNDVLRAKTGHKNRLFTSLKKAWQIEQKQSTVFVQNVENLRLTYLFTICSSIYV